jgi:preprotein translocase subunit SecA
VRIRSEDEVAQLEAEERRRAEAQLGRMQFEHAETGGYGSEEEAAQAQSLASTGEGVLAQTRVGGAKIGRNEPCPCGSGKKYKQCHGQLA